MNRRRLPFVFFGAGVLIKLLLIGLTKLGDFPSVVSIATRYDPFAFMFANWGASLFFSAKRIAPGNGEVQIFEALLAIGFGVECLLLGYIIRWLLGVIPKVPRRYQRSL
jgi:hypothetical protein